MPSAVIEYSDGTKQEYDFLRGGEAAASEKAVELLEKEGHLADYIYTLNWENDLDNVLKWK